MSRLPKIIVLLSILFFAAACKPVLPNEPVCTREAKLCPDGSSVGRIGPNCEFAPCPQSPPQSSNPKPAPPKDEENIYCTQDAMQCPDGSWTSRTPPKCEFAPCP